MLIQNMPIPRLWYVIADKLGNLSSYYGGGKGLI